MFNSGVEHPAKFLYGWAFQAGVNVLPIIQRAAQVEAGQKARNAKLNKKQLQLNVIERDLRENHLNELASFNMVIRSNHFKASANL